MSDQEDWKTRAELAEERLAQVEAELAFYDTPAVRALVTELARARKEHPKPFNSAHEGYSILNEEREELWAVVMWKKMKTPVGEHIWREKLRKEAVQVGAMALRFIEEVCDGRMAN